MNTPGPGGDNEQVQRSTTRANKLLSYGREQKPTNPHSLDNEVLSSLHPCQKMKKVSSASLQTAGEKTHMET